MMRYRLRRKFLVFAGISLLILVVLRLFVYFSNLGTEEWSPGNPRIVDHINTVLKNSVSEILSNENEGHTLKPSDPSPQLKIQHVLACFTAQSQRVQNFHSQFYNRWPDKACISSSSRGWRKRIDRTRIIEELCSLQRGKSILLVGPITSYFLHTLWLHALTPHYDNICQCRSADTCSWCHICLSPNMANASEGPFGSKIAPTEDYLIQTGSTLLRYVLSTTLYHSTKRMDPVYSSPVVDHLTGVRVRESFWIGRARNSSLIVLNRPPVPAPAWTHDETPEGDWTFALDLTRKQTFSLLLTEARTGQDNSFKRALVINAALHVTISVFLPSIMGTLRKLRSTSEIRAKTLVWHGNWYMHPHCGHHFQSRMNIPGIPLDQVDGMDPWILYHNAQVYMQDILLSELLPHFNTVYLPLSRFMDAGALGASESSNDCLTYPVGSVSANAMAVAFLGGLTRIVHALEDT